jgi:hypothetical protein
MIVRRPGCSLCREEALDLSTVLYPDLPDPKPRLISVVAERTSLTGYLECFKGVSCRVVVVRTGN